MNQGFSTAIAVTPSDNVNIPIPSHSLYIGGAGNIAVLMNDGSTVTFSGIPAGTTLPIAVQRVNATNTTATNIVALA